MHENSKKRVKFEQENSFDLTQSRNFKKNTIRYDNYLFKKAQKERNVFGVILLISNQRAQHPTELICK